jgi:hypothetical protein
VPAFPRREFGITATKSNLSYGGDVQSTSNTFKGAFSFAHAALGRDVTIADLLETLARPEDYVRGVLENLYACLSQRSGNQRAIYLCVSESQATVSYPITELIISMKLTSPATDRMVA